MLCWNRFETNCIGCTVVLLTKVCALACKKQTNCELIGNYTLEKGCTWVSVCYIVTCILSPFLLATKSGVGFVLEFKRDKTHTDFVCFFSILAEVVPQLSKN